MTDCPLCTKVAAPPAEELVWQFPHSTAFLGPWQFYRGYCVLVAKVHAAELFELPSETRRAFLEEMCLLAEAISRAFQPRKMNYELLGNQVPHLHWHLFPRYDSDPDKLRPAWLTIESTSAEQQVKLRGQDPASTIANLKQQIAALAGGQT